MSDIEYSVIMSDVIKSLAVSHSAPQHMFSYEIEMLSIKFA